MNTSFEKYADRGDLLERKRLRIADEEGMYSGFDKKPPATPKPSDAAASTSPPDTPPAVATKSTIEATYSHWQRNPSPRTMSTLLQQAMPTIESAITTYAGTDNPVLRGRAKIMAVQAIQRYKPESGVPLKNWIMTHLHGLQRYSHQASPITAPERAKMDNYRLNQAAAEFKAVSGDDPSTDELSQSTGLSPQRIKYVRRIDRPIANEGQLINWDSDEDEGDYLPGIPDNAWETTLAEYVYHDLDDTNKRIYDMYMGRNGYPKNMSIQQIARKLRITPSAVSQRATRISQKIEDNLSLKEVL